MTSTGIVQEIVVEAPRQRVFDALTKPSDLERWWTTRAESEPRPGGRFRYEWTFEGAPERDHTQEGAYSTFVQGERVGYPWKVGSSPTQVEFTLEEREGRSSLRLAHDGWAERMDEARGHHEQGWNFFLHNLKTVLEDGVDRRAEALGMRVRR